MTASPAASAIAWRPIVATAALDVLLHVLFSSGYGWHRDEFYYLGAGRRLAWGFPDVAPVTPALAHVTEALFGPSVRGLRLVAALAGGVVVVLAGLVARELGADRPAQAVACALVLATPVLFGASTLFQTVPFDQVVWAALFWLTARLLRTEDRRLWLGIGVVAGTGLLTKQTIVCPLGALATAMLVWRRDLLRGPWPWAAAGLAIVLGAPNVWWQASHGFPMQRFVATQQALHPERFARSTFVGGQLVLLGPVLLPIALAGLRELFVRPPFRVLGWVVAGTFGALLAAAGKAYYAGPLAVPLMAAGALAVSRWARTARRRSVLAGLVAASFLGTLPFMAAALPVRTMIDTRIYTVRAEFAEMLGWDDLVDTVAGVWNALPASDRDRTLILTRSYGEAGAIEVLGAPRGLPFPASGHDAWFFWKPPRDPAVVIGIGVESVCRAFFRDVRQVATIDNRFGVPNQSRGLPVFVCRDPMRSLVEHWDEVAFFA
jgi:hypothetical protein